MNYNYPPNFAPNMMMPRPASLPVTLYVGNLDDSVHEEQLFSHFSKYGPLHSIKIVKDRNTGKSRGFGYVNFMNFKDAETARMIAQYDLIGRKPIRILHKSSDPKQKTEANLFVKNIDPSVTFKELHNHFSRSGAVLSVKIAYNRAGKHLGYGYVQLEKPEDAAKAIQELNGSKLKEKEITVEKFTPKQGRKVTSNNNLYVKHLPEGKSKEEIEKILTDDFSKYGKIISLLAVSRDGGKVWSAFVCFESPEAAANALNELNGSVTMEGSTEPLYVNFHASRQERALEMKGDQTNKTNLIVKNLKPDVTDQQFRELFNTFGEITQCGLKEVEFKGQKYKMAFVNFKYPEEATNAQSNGQQKEEIKKLFYNDTPYIGLWLSKEQRQQFKQTMANRRPYNSHLRELQNPGYQQPYPGYIQPPQPFGVMQQQQFPPQPFQQGGPRPFTFNPHLNQQSMPPQQNQPQMQNPQGQQPPQFQQRGPGGGGQFNRTRQGQFANNRGGPGQYQRGPGPHQPRMGGPGGPNQGMYNRGPNQNQNRRPPNQQNQQLADNVGGNSRPNQPEPNTKASEPTQALTVQNLKDKLDDFMRLEPEKQRNILGELLYPKILGVAGPTFAPKITGMLVDFDVLTIQDILELLEDQSTLNERISEAQELIVQEGEGE